MKKIKNLIKAVLLTVAAAVIMTTALACNDEKESNFYNDEKESNFYNDEKESDFYADWMTHINDSALITDVIMPGSHDAGSYTMMALGETQSDSIYNQLINGVRYFDLRVKVLNGELVIFHGVVSGIAFDEVLNDIKSFITENPEEVLILDFQHFENNAEPQVSELLDEKLDAKNKAINKSVAFDALTMGYFRENKLNYVITWGSGKNDADYLLPRGQYLYSPYNETIHKDPEHSRLIDEGFPVYYSEKPDEKIFVLQAQLTASKLSDTPLSREEVFRPLINDYVNGLCTSPLLAKTNVIMRDYITSDTENIKSIIRLNVYKNLVKEDAKTEFTNQLDK